MVSLITMTVGWLIFALVLAGLAWSVSRLLSRRTTTNSGDSAILEARGNQGLIFNSRIQQAVKRSVSGFHFRKRNLA